jgi:hypothetical protein
MKQYAAGKRMKKPKCYVVLYKFRGETRQRTCEDGPWDYYCNAIEHRNWFFGHSPDVTECWIQETAGEDRGKRLTRD